ncbi:hypothetical protein IB236_13065 [Acidovorax sp. ACV02]|uniref:hypothetical protein n=1 Tax=Acidovorax sp. ACV02 TaxID=2769310 RepID=UPI00177EF63B|nr:hypothetical protein [Acidovorax sp. ACV02]MBD9406272.1 hypothetical protein [Acidovorax sp. ACV02]
MEMQIGKGRDGWEAKTAIEMGAANRVLIVSTGKTNGGMVTRAVVNTDNKDGFLTWDMFGDYSARTVYKGARCTEKTVRELHQLALSKIEETLAAARAHYAAKEGAAA